MRKFIYILFLFVFAACSERINPEKNGGTIQMSAVVVEAEAATKSSAEPWRGTAPGGSPNNLPVKLLFSLQSGVYSHNPAAPSMLPSHTTIDYTGPAFVDPDPVDGSKLKYPDDDTEVYCVGLYPQDGWMVESPYTVAEHSVNGSDDIMFASQISGSLLDKFEAQEYKHLLTWLKICVCATSRQAIEHWGKITDVSVSTKDKIMIDLATGSQSYSSNVAYIDALDAALTLSTAIQEVGSVFSTPSTSYTLRVTSEKRGTQEVTLEIDKDINGVEVTSPEQVKGCLYILELYFNRTTLTAKCTLRPWDYQYESLELK